MEDFDDDESIFELDKHEREKLRNQELAYFRHERRAQAVLNKLLELADEPLDLDSSEFDAEIRSEVRNQLLTQCIAENLDAHSIWPFIFSVHDFVESNRARLKAGKRHAEHREMKREVFDWLDQNMPNFSSMDAAAEAIAGKLVPIKWRTARDWVALWKKERSAGRP
jgi:hypothetical protein